MMNKSFENVIANTTINDLLWGKKPRMNVEFLHPACHIPSHWWSFFAVLDLYCDHMVNAEAYWIVDDCYCLILQNRYYYYQIFDYFIFMLSYNQTITILVHKNVLQLLHILIYNFSVSFSHNALFFREI